MSNQLLENNVELVFMLPVRGAYERAALIRVAELLLLGFVVWRLWKFTIFPILYPDNPKELPYWIPFFGHGLAFFHNSQTLLAKASKHFGTVKEPFALNIFGSTLYVISDPKLTNEVYKNLETLSFIEFVQGLFRTNGVTEAGIKAAYMDLPSDKAGFPNPQGKSLGGTLVRQMHINQLYPGDNLDQLESRFLKYFQDQVTLPMMRKACAPYAVAQNGSSIDLPLMLWCSEYFVRAGGLAYFGEVLSAIDPQLAPTFIAFDDLSWQAIYQYPSFLSRRMRAERDQTQRAFKKYFEVPQTERTGALGLLTLWRTSSAPSASARTTSQQYYSPSTGRRSPVLIQTINTNTRKTAFWTLTYLLRNPSYIEPLRKETATAFDGDTLVDLNHLHTKCPMLDAVWFETLRLASNAASVRRVTEDTVIGGKVLRKGSRIMIPYRLLHFDEAIYGNDVHAFKPERFLGPAAEKLARGDSWGPFGGGKTMCSGRHVAKRATLMFLAMILYRFDIAIVGDNRMPAADLARPVLGVMAVSNDEDYTIRISTRQVVV